MSNQPMDFEPILVPTEQTIDEAARLFLRNTAPRKVIAFYAPMGCGKTTFIKALCRCLHISDVVNSPTFAIINRYGSAEDGDVTHIDCYRLKSLDEALAIGMTDYLKGDHYCFIEWPELIEPLLDDDVTLRVAIEEQPDGSRVIKPYSQSCRKED